MYRSDRTPRAERFMQESHQNPSFSATLLDKIYRSIDEPEAEAVEMKIKKQSKPIAKNNRYDDYDNDALFFSSNSSSSDSSSAGFSSSDTESMCGVKPRASAFLPPLPIRTAVSSRKTETSVSRTEEKQRTLFQEQRRVSVPLFDDYSSHSQRFSSSEEIHHEGIIKSKSRALKIYANLKKVKQPISPGGRLASFINSLFTPVKKSKNSPSIHSFDDMNIEKDSKSYQASACSSASSFSRSCLSKNSPGRIRNGPKRSVRFYPVSIILNEDLKPCGHKSLSGNSGPILPPAPPSKIGRPNVKKIDDEKRNRAAEKTRIVKEAANDFLRDYHRSQKEKRNNSTARNSSRDDYRVHDDDDEDDASSCSSSDLFELDHLAVMGKDSRYREELPVYETTHFRVR